MKLCVLTSGYEQSTSALQDYDTPMDLADHFAGHEVTVEALHKATAIRRVRELAEQGFDVFVNLCDGAWEDDCAGIEVAQALERLGQAFTGAASDFYEPTRETMKRVCHYWGLPTPPHRFARTRAQALAAGAELGFPLIVKHPNGYSSMGMTKDSRVATPEALGLEAERIIGLYGEALIERFIEGREFTVLVVEDPDNPGQPLVFNPIEYRFPEGESFKHYNLKWVDYQGLVSTHSRDEALNEKLKAISGQFFTALGGSGYGRCDIRVDGEGNPYILEINPNCGIFYPASDPGSADLILLAEPGGYARFVDCILRSALKRQQARLPVWTVAFAPGGSEYGMLARLDIAEGQMIDPLEERPHHLVTRAHVEKCWDAQGKDWFARYAWPLTDEVWVMWSPLPEDWKPINHSCDPNAWLSGLDLIARRPIARGEAITMDYATFYHETMPAFACACGATTCRGTVSGADLFSPALDAYGEHLSDYVRTRRGRGQ